MEYFRIKNWEKYQHRDAARYPRMPWIKLHTSMFRDEKIMQMTPYQIWIWVNLLLLAGEKVNKLPLCLLQLRSLMVGVRPRKKLNLQFLWDLDLIEAYDCQQSAILDLDLDKTKTARARKDTLVPLAAAAVDEEIWKGIWNAYPKTTRKLGVLSEDLARMSLVRENLPPCELPLLLNACKNYSDASRDQDPKFVRKFDRFLNDNFWRSYVDETPAKSKNARLLE